MFKAPFSFDGRIRRIEYFLSGIVGGIVFSIAWALGIGTFILGAGMGSAGGSVFGLLIGLAALVASMWFSLAQGVKRLHDLDKSGWLILLMFVPIVNALFGLYMLFADGTVGPNQYGEDPKNRMPYQAQPSSVNVTVNVAREEVKVEKLTDECSQDILKLIYNFQDILVQVTEKNEPSILARYLIDLAKAYSSFYNENKIIVEDKEVQNARVYLTYATSEVLKQGAKLLGIEMPEKM